MSNDRARFGRVELLTICVAAIILVSLGIYGVLVARNSARRMECTNNLKQMGIAIHNFHDTRRGLPPLLMGPDRASLFVYIIPYAEKQSYYDQIDFVRSAEHIDCIPGKPGEVPGTYLGCSMASNWLALNSAERRNGFASIKYHTCPSRRSGLQIRRTGNWAGPLNDYAVGIVYEQADGDAAGGNSHWGKHWDACQPAEHVEPIMSAFQVADVDGCSPNGTGSAKDMNHHNHIFRRARPRDRMASVGDGTSYTFFLGEKHIRVGEFGRCCSDKTFDVGADGSYLAENDEVYYTVSRSAQLPIADGPKAFARKRSLSDDGGPGADYGFGSWHADVCLFLKGDGSVVIVSNDIDVSVLKGAFHCSDGAKFEAE